MTNIKTNTKKLEKSQIEITCTLDAKDFESYEDQALERLSKNVEIPGFRKGKVPKETAKKHVGEMMLLEEMAGIAINEAYPKILEEEKIDAIGRPEIGITKIAKGNDLEFKITTAVLPEVKLPDYKKIAKKENSNDEYKKELEVTEDEMKKTIDNLRKSRAHQDLHKDGGDKDDHSHGEITEDKWPALDDKFVKSLGKFENVEDFKNKLRENMKMEKEMMQKDKRRLKIVEEIIKETKVEIPEILITSETNKLLYKMEADIANMGLKFDDYLAQIKKTREDLKKDWRDEAEKRAKLEMVLFKISEDEKLKPSDEDVKKEVEKIATMYKDADPIRARAYIEQVLTNEKVFAFLDEQ